MEHFLYEMVERFPRLKEVDLSYSDKDLYSQEDTPAGSVEILYFDERTDFENAIIALAFKLERRQIPSSMGAVFLGGLADRVNRCKVSLVVLSRGGYSGITAEEVGISEDEWIEKSFAIRKNHELAHFIQRKMYPENKNALRDEIKADMVGLIAAFGNYRTDLARLFLGIEGITYREGGRLQNYADESTDIMEMMKEANEYIDGIQRRADGKTDGFKCLMDIEKVESERI